jgi:LAO/AO transport system kinase
MIRDIEDNVPSVLESLKALYPHTGRAYIIGVTGSPGVGKSTLVDQMVFQYRKQGKTIGILAVDPTSPLTGGALLGDRLRMQRHSIDEGVFIRSIANRGWLGGVAMSTRNAIDVLDAMGKNVIIVETVGVGQGEVDVVKSVHTTVIVGSPGMGDDIQAIKAGILEVGDIFVINKGDREGTEKAVSNLRLMIEINRGRYKQSNWRPPIIITEAISGKGVPELLDALEKHTQHLLKLSNDLNLRREEGKVREELKQILKNRLIQLILDPLVDSGEFEAAVKMIVSGKSDPYSISDKLLANMVL